MRSHRTLRLRARMGTASEHSGKSYLAQRPTRGCAAVRRGTRPSGARDDAGMAWRANGRGEPFASTAWPVAATPATLGGLGFQSAMCTAPAAYWGACAKMLSYWHIRQPRHVYKHWSAAAPADRPSARYSRRCQPAVKRRLAGMPHLGSTPGHLTRSPVRAGSRAWRLASWLAVSRMTYPFTLRSRSRATAPPGAGSPGTVGHTHGQVHISAARGHANRSSQTPPANTGMVACRRRLDAWGAHALACTRSGLLARRANTLSPQRWLSHTLAK